MSGQRILVAGGSRGIGKAVAQALAVEDYQVTVIARNESQLTALQDKLSHANHSINIVVLDLTDRKAVADFFDQQNRPFDSMIVAAGIARHRPVYDILDQDIDDTLEVNISVPIICTRAFANLSIKHGAAGSIVLFSSQLAHVGAPERGLYCASKAAVDGFVRGAVADLSHYGIRINSVCPTFTETEMTRDALSDDQFRKAVEAKIPLGRLGQPNDCVGICKFLVSNESAMITGTSIKVDGGWTAL